MWRCLQRATLAASWPSRYRAVASRGPCREAVSQRRYFAIEQQRPPTDAREQDEAQEAGLTASEDEDDRQQEARKAARARYMAEKRAAGKLPSWYPDETAQLESLLQKTTSAILQDEVPCPVISSIYSWTVFNHSSCYDFGQQPDLAPVDVPFPECSNEGYSEHGFGLLDFTLTRLISRHFPNLGRIAIARMRIRLEQEDVLTRLAHLYGFRSRIRCDYSSTAAVGYIRSYEAGAVAFKAYIWAVCKEFGVDAAEAWLERLFIPLAHATYADFGGTYAHRPMEAGAQFEMLAHLRHKNVQPLGQISVSNATLPANNGSGTDSLDPWGVAEYDPLPGWDAQLVEGIPLLHSRLKSLTSQDVQASAPSPALSDILQWTVFQHHSCYNAQRTENELFFEVGHSAYSYKIFAMHGDALMCYIMTCMLATFYPNLSSLSIIFMRARLVANNVFARLAVVCGLMVRLHVNAAKPRTIQQVQTVEEAADVFEGFVWAVYQEHGILACSEWIVKLFGPLAEALYEDHGGKHEFEKISPEDSARSSSH